MAEMVGARARTGAPGSDDGSASALMVGIAALACVVLVALAVGIGALVAVARAQSVADLAALAGAEVAVAMVWELSPGDPCGVAAEVVHANGLGMATCTEHGAGRVSVAVTVATSLGEFSAQALAGPDLGAHER